MRGWTRLARRAGAIAVIAGGTAAGVWLFASANAPARIVHLSIDGRAVTAEERGRGPIVLLAGATREMAALPSALAAQQRVWTSPPDGTAERVRDLARAAAAEGGTVRVVATIAEAGALLPTLTAAAQMVVLDVGDRSSSAQVDAVFVTGRPLLVLTHGAGAAWRRFRERRAPAAVNIALIEACRQDLTPECARHVATFITATHGQSTGPVTGDLIEDVRASGGTGPAMRVVPSGQFMTNVAVDTTGVTSSLFAVPAIIPTPIAVALTETTVAEFRRFVEVSGYRPASGCWYHTVEQEWKYDEAGSWATPVFPQDDRHPVTCITFEDAAAYAAWLSADTRASYRLPSEAEFAWFRAAGVAAGEQVSASDWCARANGADRASGLAYATPCDDGFEATAPVGSFPPNAFGLFDTSGNLWELTADCWQASSVRALKHWVLGATAPDDAGEGDCAGRHVVGGGAYLSSPTNLSIGMRESKGIDRRASVSASCGRSNSARGATAPPTKVSLDATIGGESGSRAVGC